MPRRNQRSKIPPARYINTQICSDKRRYPTKREALAVKEHQELITMGLELKVYKCTTPGCGGWHLTRV